MSGQVYATMDGYQSSGASLTVLPLPSITGITPSAGEPGTFVYIQGSSFGSTQGSSTLAFNGVPATINSWSDGQISAYVPSNATTGPVTIVENNVTSNTNQSFTVSTPAIGAILPAAAAVGSQITITGSGFTSQGLTTQVFFNGVAAQVF